YAIEQTEYGMRSVLIRLGPLSCAFGIEDYAHRPNEDDEIEQQRRIFHIEQVELQFLPCVVKRRAVWKVNLSPTANSWLDGVTFAIKSNLLFEMVHKIRPLRSRAYEAHVPFKYIDQLRQLIDTNFSNPSADPGHSWIVFRRPLRISILLRVN